MKLYTGKYEVIYSGTVILTRENTVKFQFPKSDGSMILILNFIDSMNNSDEDTKIRTTIAGETLEMDIPFDKTDGGNPELMDLGSIRGKRMFLNIRATNATNLSPTIHYSFYLRKEEHND